MSRCREENGASPGGRQVREVEVKGGEEQLDMVQVSWMRSEESSRENGAQSMVWHVVSGTIILGARLKEV